MSQLREVVTNIHDNGTGRNGYKHHIADENRDHATSSAQRILLSAHLEFNVVSFL